MYLVHQSTFSCEHIHASMPRNLGGNRACGSLFYQDWQRIKCRNKCWHCTHTFVWRVEAVDEDAVSQDEGPSDHERTRVATNLQIKENNEQHINVLLFLRGLPWWASGLTRCYWLLAVFHHWGTKGLPRWQSGLRRSHWLLAVSHHWGPALMAEWLKALSLTASCLSPLGHKGPA